MKLKLRAFLVCFFMLMLFWQIYTLFPENGERHHRRQDPLPIKKNEWTVRFVNPKDFEETDEPNAIQTQLPDTGSDPFHKGPVAKGKVEMGNPGQRSEKNDDDETDPDLLLAITPDNNPKGDRRRPLMIPILSRRFQPVPRRDIVPPSMDDAHLRYPLFSFSTVTGIETLPHASLVQEDLYHTPLATALGYAMHAGLHLSYLATSGARMGWGQRNDLEQEWRDQRRVAPGGQVDSSTPSARELFAHLIQGDSLRLPLQLQDATERYFVVEQDFYGPALERARRRRRIMAQASTATSLLESAAAWNDNGGGASPGGESNVLFISNSFCEDFVRLLNVPHNAPLVVHLPDVSLVSTFALQCVYWRTHALRKVGRRFVLLVTGGDPDDTASSSFSTAQVASPLPQFPQVNMSYLLSHPLLAHWYSVHGDLQSKRFTSLPRGFPFFHRSGRSLLLQTAERQKAEEVAHERLTRHLLHGLDIQRLFMAAKNASTHGGITVPPLNHLAVAHYTCLWLEDALDVFGENSLHPPTQWIPLAQLPARVTTIYLVLLPVELGSRRQDTLHELTNQVLVFREKWEDSVSIHAAQHVALLPLTAALYGKLQQHQHGAAERELKVLVMPGTEEGSRSKPLYEYLKAHPELSHMTSGAAGTEEYYAALNRFAFVACPLGESYDSSCIWEALAFGAIPLVLNTTESPGTFSSARALLARPEYRAAAQSRGELQFDLGPHVALEKFLHLPSVIARSVGEVTTENLAKWRDAIFKKLNLNIVNINDLFMGPWMDRIYTHHNDPD